MPLKRIGLIAGNGSFPALFIEAARKNGYTVLAAAIKRDTKRVINKLAAKVVWVEAGEFRKAASFFKANEIKDVVMAGQISPARLFDKKVKWDEELQQLLAKVENRKTNTLFKAVAGLLAKESLNLLDSTLFLDEKNLPKKGPLTNVELEEFQWEDIRFGFDLAKKSAGLDIGQTVVVKNKCIIAVEAFEGTNSAILRAGRLAGSGTVVVKVSRPDQDLRFDVPVIGVNTIRCMNISGAKVLAIEAGKTVILDADKTLLKAKKSGIAIVSVE